VALKPWLGILFGMVIGLLATGVILLATSHPRGEPVRLSPLPTTQPLIVHVSGAVAHPGIYTLPPGSRVNDAILAAGGISTGADQSGLNLAAPLQDGQLIRVSTNASSQAVVPQEGQVSSGDPTTTILDHLININTAGQEELESLPGIGPVLAQRIIKYRNAYGLFQTIEDINVIYGLSPETYAMIKDLITVDPESTSIP
jgi:competence protein ComEA